MNNTKKRGFDYTTVLLLVVAAACLVGMFFSPIETVEFDWDVARAPVKLYFHNVYPECTLQGIDPEYTGDIVVVEMNYRKNGKDYTLTDIADSFLAESGVRHIRFTRLPENVSAGAFDVGEEVTIYVDYVPSSVELPSNVVVKSTEDFAKLIEPKQDFEFIPSTEQLLHAVETWAGDERVMLGTTVPLALVMFLLCFLRQKSGRANPLWPIFRNSVGKFLFTAFCYTVGFVTAVLLFCEEVDVGLDFYSGVEFLMGWPLKVLLVASGLFLLKDLLSRDFPWFIARWVVRIAIAVVIIMICAAVGWAVAAIVTANAGFFRLLYILLLICVLTIPISGGNKVERVVKVNMRPERVIADDGTSVRVDYFADSTYVGDDLILDYGPDTMRGASGREYRKR